VFALCAIALAWPISVLLQARRFWPAGWLAVMAIGFVANMIFINLSRTATTIGSIWVAMGLSYMAVRTRGFRDSSPIPSFSD